MNGTQAVVDLDAVQRVLEEALAGRARSETGIMQEILSRFPEYNPYVLQEAVLYLLGRGFVEVDGGWRRPEDDEEMEQVRRGWTATTREYRRLLLHGCRRGLAVLPQNPFLVAEWIEECAAHSDHRAVEKLHPLLDRSYFSPQRWDELRAAYRSSVDAVWQGGAELPALDLSEAELETLDRLCLEDQVPVGAVLDASESSIVRPLRALAAKGVLELLPNDEFRVTSRTYVTFNWSQPYFAGELEDYHDRQRSLDILQESWQLFDALADENVQAFEGCSVLAEVAGALRQRFREKPGVLTVEEDEMEGAEESAEEMVGAAALQQAAEEWQERFQEWEQKLQEVRQALAAGHRGDDSRPIPLTEIHAPVDLDALRGWLRQRLSQPLEYSLVLFEAGRHFPHWQPEALRHALNFLLWTEFAVGRDQVCAVPESPDVFQAIQEQWREASGRDWRRLQRQVRNGAAVTPMNPFEIARWIELSVQEDTLESIPQIFPLLPREFFTPERFFELEQIHQLAVRSVSHGRRSAPAGGECETSEGTLGKGEVRRLGREWVTAALEQAGFDWKLAPPRSGSHLLAWPAGAEANEDDAHRIRITSSSGECFDVSARYAEDSDLFLVYVWYVGMKGQTEAYGMPASAAIQFAEARGWTRTRTWQTYGGYAPIPGKQLIQSLQPYRMTPEKWRGLSSAPMSGSTWFWHRSATTGMLSAGG